MRVQGGRPLGPGLLSLRPGLAQGLLPWHGLKWFKIHMQLCVRY